jgi:LPS-assembly lipoprotein
MMSMNRSGQHSRAESGGRSGGYGRGLVLIGLALMVSACGFQLRGEARLPPSMNQTELVAADATSAFVRELERLLLANGVTLVDRGSDSAARLRIVAERMRREALTIAGDARVREFVLIFEVTLSVVDGEGRVLMPEETLRLSRDYSFDEQEILAATREEEFLRADLRQAMAARVLRRLEGLSGP